MRSGKFGGTPRPFLPTSSARFAPASIFCAFLAALSAACGSGSKPNPKPTPTTGTIAPLPRSVRVEPDRVVVEGHWVPIEVEPRTPALPNTVRVTCSRGERSCTEDLTRLASPDEPKPINESLEYRVEEWTKWGKPIATLVASRRVGGTQVEIRVSLSGLAAEKVVIETGRETRWRIE